MARFFRLAGYVLGSIVLLLVAGAAGLFAWTNSAVSKKVPLPTHTFTAPADSASVARGSHVIEVLAKCYHCHGQDYGGTVMVDDPAFATLAAPNLTRGKGGIAAGYDDAAFERAIRHGVARDGRRLIVMPSNEYQYLSDEDLGAIIAYLKSVRAVDRETTPTRLGPVARALFAAGKLPLFPGDEVQHTTEVVPAVPIDTTIEYGRYIGNVGCAGCHGMTYGGGPIPGAPPDFPPPANITPRGIGHYTFDAFQQTLRTGVRPDGTKLNPFMPVEATKLMTDVEMKAVWNFLRSLPPREYGTR